MDISERYEWVCHLDLKSGDVYYQNTNDGTVQLEKPNGSIEPDIVCHTPTTASHKHFTFTPMEMMESKTEPAPDSPQSDSIDFSQNISLSKARRANKKPKRRKKSPKKSQRRSQTMDVSVFTKVIEMEQIPEQIPESPGLKRAQTHAVIAPSFAAPTVPGLLAPKPPKMLTSKSAETGTSTSTKGTYLFVC